MSPGTNYLIQNIFDWMETYIEYQETPWWKFKQKRSLKILLDWCYPLVRSQFKNYIKK